MKKDKEAENKFFQEFQCSLDEIRWNEDKLKG
jgi:hypothetical protein